jgi:hypothetical protein
MSAKPDDNFSVKSEQNVGASPVNTPKDSVSRREFIKTTAVAGAATAVSSFPYIRPGCRHWLNQIRSSRR